VKIHTSEVEINIVQIVDVNSNGLLIVIHEFNKICELFFYLKFFIYICI
jgi:hypothetical protein